LFTTRARVVGQGRPASEATGYLSGLLIGADVAGSPGLLGCDPAQGVALLGDARLCGLYARALGARGLQAEIFDGEAAAVAGLWALHGARAAS
jgi:2-dehydro-3-deoxygalactonokinase